MLFVSAGWRREEGTVALVGEAKRQCGGHCGLGSNDRKDKWIGTSPKGKCIQFGFALGSPCFPEFPGGVCWLAGSQSCERQSLEAGRLGFKSQLLHFLALGIQASLFIFGGSDSKESACNAGDPGWV